MQNYGFASAKKQIRHHRQRPCAQRSAGNGRKVCPHRPECPHSGRKRRGQGEFQRISRKHPDKIPIICEKEKNSKLKDIEKTKYLIDKNLILPQFSGLIRRKLELNENDSLFFLVNGKVTISGTVSMIDIYNKYKEKDGFLYIAYASAVTWGNKII